MKNEFLAPIVPRKMTRMHKAPILPLATPNTDWYYRSAVYFGIKTWNILPINIRISESLEIFKAGIKKYLFIYVSLLVTARSSDRSYIMCFYYSILVMSPVHW